MRNHHKKFTTVVYLLAVSFILSSSGNIYWKLWYNW